MSSYTNQDTASSGDDILYGRAEDHPTIVKVLVNKQDSIMGLGGDDIIIGDHYSDQVSLTEDVLNGGDGDDWLFGDTVNFSEETLQIVMNRTLTPISIFTDDAFNVDITGDVDWRTREYSNTARDELEGGADDDHLFGGAGSDLLSGSGGNDYLDGGTRDDQMSGGTGNDTYIVDDIFDIVDELNGSGVDIVLASVSFSLDSQAVSQDVENLFLRGHITSISGTGNAKDNEIDASGNGGANRLTGLGGNDTFVVGDGDTVVEQVGGGTDTVKAYQMGLHLSDYKNVENATIINGDFNLDGSNTNNKLTGSDDDNHIFGGRGRDILIGGGGSDFFSFTHINQSGRNSATRDVITDFKADDTIVLSDIDANSNKPGEQSFSYIGFADFHRKAGELHAVRVGNNVIVEGDVNGDRSADFQIELKGNVALRLNDFDL